MDVYEKSLELHEKHAGKLEVVSKVPLKSRDDLSLAYTPGVAEPCRRINKNPEDIYRYTSKGNMVAVVTDGTAVLGLGDIGPGAGLPVMEGKALLFKNFAGVDAFPICIRSKDVDTIVETVRLIEPTFGGVNLEDISAPRCFEIEARLKKELDIPVFHDDQHGTAVVTLAGLMNALKIVKKGIGDLKVVFNGAGAGAIACAKFYMSSGVKDVVLCDTKGPIYEGRAENMNSFKQELAKITNTRKVRGTLADALAGADVFVGLSAGNIVTADMVASMARDAIVFACANPLPEIMPDEARKGSARVVATGRSDFPNQINNVLGFPGIFRGALDTRARDINHEMKLAGANAIADLIPEKELREDFIIPSPLNPRVAPAVARAVAKAAIDSGVARIKADPQKVYEKTVNLVKHLR